MVFNNLLPVFLSKNAFFKQLGKIIFWSFLFCFLTLIAFLPNNIPLIGLLALVIFIYLGKALAKEKWPVRIGLTLFISILFQWFLFQDIILALIHIAHIPRFEAWGLFLLHGIIWQIKIPLMLLLPFYLEKRINMPLFLSLPFFAWMTEFISWEIIPWSWAMYAINDSHIRQYASIGGMQVVSLFVFLFALLLYEIRFTQIKYFISIIRKEYFTKKRIRKAVAYSAVWIFFVTIYLYGYYLSKPEKGYATIKVAYIQTDTGRAYRSLADDLEFVQKSLNQFFSLSVSLLKKPEEFDLIVLPESAIPFHGVNSNEENKQKGIYSVTFQSILKFLAYFGNAPVVFNEMGYEQKKLYNYISVMDSNGTVSERYQKRRLFPFGEYIPLSETFPRLRSLFTEASHYTSGQKNTIMSFQLEQNVLNEKSRPDLPTLNKDFLTQMQNPDFIFTYPKPILKKQKENVHFVPLLCYEGLWQDLTIHSIREARKKNIKYDFLVNLANDTWFGAGIIAGLHLSSARWRAIESGRSLVRVGLENNSVLISPKGDFLSPISQKGVDIGRFFVPLYKMETAFVRYGLLLPFFIIIIFGIAIFYHFYSYRRKLLLRHGID